MNDLPVDPYDAMGSYMEAVQPYLVAIQQAYDQLLDLEGLQAQPSMPIVSAPAVSAPRSEHPVPPRPPSPPAPAPQTQAPPPGSTGSGSTEKAYRGFESWGNPSARLGASSQPPPTTTSNPLQKTMWPNELAVRTEALPENPPDDDFDDYELLPPRPPGGSRRHRQRQRQWRQRQQRQWRQQQRNIMNRTSITPTRRAR